MTGVGGRVELRRAMCAHCRLPRTQPCTSDNTTTNKVAQGEATRPEARNTTPTREPESGAAQTKAL